MSKNDIPKRMNYEFDIRAKTRNNLLNRINIYVDNVTYAQTIPFDAGAYNMRIGEFHYLIEQEIKNV